MGTESLPGPSPGRVPPELEPRRGMRLGRYELLAPLASGGMARVWIARLAGEHGFERLVALKTMRPEHVQNDGFRRMFLDEARLAARIAHANVVQVLDLGEEGGVVYQAMALVDGGSITGLLRRRKELGTRGLPAGIAARIVADALCGLHAAHELTDDEGRPFHLVHRDVSPQNVLVGIDGTAKIADFGVAKARSRLADETEAGQVKGKFAYMAPEQLERRPVDRRADIFATGVVLWEALTGRRLFGGIDLLDTIAKLREGAIPDPRTAAPAVPGALAEVTMHALERDPEKRFPTAAEMSDALDQAARACGTSATTKEVGALVADLCADELAMRREAVRDAVRAVTVGGPEADPGTHAAQMTSATTTIADGVGGGPRRTWMRRAAAGAAVAVVAIGVVVAAAYREAPQVAAPASAPAPAAAPASASAAAPASAPAPTPASASAPTPASAPAPTPASAPAPTPASAPALSSSPAHVHRPVSPTAPRIKYGNPYGP